MQYGTNPTTKFKTLIENQVPFAKENSDEIYVITKNTNVFIKTRNSL